jgi:hypothetical protein
MNALSIVYELKRLLKRYRSRVANSYWVMGHVCNGDLSPMDWGWGVSVCKGGRERENLILKIYTHIFHVSSTKLAKNQIVIVFFLTKN